MDCDWLELARSYKTIISNAQAKSTAPYAFDYPDDYQTMGKKILCGKFAERLKNNFAVGD